MASLYIMHQPTQPDQLYKCRLSLVWTSLCYDLKMDVSPYRCIGLVVGPFVFSSSFSPSWISWEDDGSIQTGPGTIPAGSGLDSFLGIELLCYFCSILLVLYPLYDFSFVSCVVWWPIGLFSAIFIPAVLFVYTSLTGTSTTLTIRVILVLWRRLSIHALLISFVWIRSSVGAVVNACYLLLFICYLFVLSMLDVVFAWCDDCLGMWLINTRMIIDAWAIV